METTDIKLISHNAGNFSQPDDPSYPWKLYVNLKPPEFMQVAFCMMHGGSEEIVVRGKSKEALEAFAAKYDLNADHPRFRRMEITGPEQSLENAKVELPPNG